MPELPEVETVRRGISPAMTQASVDEIIIRQSKLRYPVPSHLAKELTGARILAVRRRAKYLIIPTTANKSLIIHLGMSGKLSITSHASPPKKHDHIDLILNNGTLIRYNDPRRFGFWQWESDPEQLGYIARLGPEPTPEAFFLEEFMAQLARRKAAIKQVIMDNQVVVGVGNIYANESLFAAGISPKRSACSLSADEVHKLHQAIIRVISKAVDVGGTTLKDFYSADGSPGYFAQELMVYGRLNAPCMVCQTPIEAIVLGQRRSFYCPNCQQ
jgi:formamidopyrimidine-DNA glycosylase